MLLDFTVTAESNSLSKKTHKKIQTQPPSDTIEMQTPLYFIFIFLLLFPAERCCDFSLTPASPRSSVCLCSLK